MAMFGTCTRGLILKATRNRSLNVLRSGQSEFRRQIQSKAFDLYGFPLSQPTRSILFLCDENTIPYNLIYVDARKLETRKPDFLQLFPVGLVPAINDDGFRVTEGAAILQYLCEKHQLSSWYPLGFDKLEAIQARAKINFWLHWHHSNLRHSTRTILVPYHYPPKGLTKEEAISKGVKDYGRAMKYVENYLKQRHENVDPNKRIFLCSDDTPTIADLLVLPEIDQLKSEAFNLYDYSPYPNVLRWLNACQTSLKSYEKNFSFVKKESKVWTGMPARK